MSTFIMNDGIGALHAYGDVIMGNPELQNKFLNALEVRIARVQITSKMWSNPLAVMNKGLLETGEVIEEIFVNLAKPHEFNPAGAERGVFVREMPDVRAEYHTMNYQKFYKQTVSQQQLRTAFTSYGECDNLIARIVDGMYTGAAYDWYIATKYVICREIVNGRIKTVETPASDTKYSKLLTAFRATSNKFTFEKKDFNNAAVYNTCPRNEQYLLIDSDIDSAIDVENLAQAFHMEKAEWLGHQLLLDGFSEHDEERLAILFGDDPTYKFFNSSELKLLKSVQAVLMGKQYMMFFDNLNEFTTQYNGEGLYWNYWLHVWKTLSVSPFENVCVFTTQASSVSGVTVSPSTATLSTGADIALNAKVTGTGFINQSVTWSIEGAKASGTKMTGNVLHIAHDESAPTITVTATSSVNSQQKGTATITVQK